MVIIPAFMLGPLLLFTTGVVAGAPAADEIASTSPRGWQSFNCFIRNPTQQLIMEQVNVLAGVNAPTSHGTVVDRPSLLELGFNR